MYWTNPAMPSQIQRWYQILLHGTNFLNPYESFKQ